MLPKRIRDKIRFQQSEKSHETAHWIWTAYSKDDRGKSYGTLSDEGNTAYAHRYVYEKIKGQLREGERLKQVCDAELCVNPNHWIKR